MPQNYIIFSDRKFIEILPTTGKDDSERMTLNGMSRQFEHLEPEAIEQAVAEFKGDHVGNITFLANSPEDVFEWVKNCYDKFIIAGGGLVVNNRGEVLVIFRNGKWDLPKGKLEEGENILTAAVREVQEETGLDRIKVVSQFGSTYHTYVLKDEHVLKETIWYLMHTCDSNLVPQTEEGITEIKWLSRSEFDRVYQNSYESIISLLKQYASTQ